MAQKPVLRGEVGCACGAVIEPGDSSVNDTELIQRGEGSFADGRWRKQSITEVLALSTHIKRHPSVVVP